MYADRQYSYSQPQIMMPRMTPVVKLLLITNIAVFVVQMFAGEWFLGMFALVPQYVMRGYIWQLVTYMFLHGSVWHLFVNMLMLFFMGPETERSLGSRRFTVMYMLAGVIGGVGWMLLSGGHGLCVGASGALFGILGVFAALFPSRRITLLVFFIIPVTMTVRTLAVGLAIFNLVWLVSGQNNGVAYAAHLAGGIAGYIYGLKIARQVLYGGGWGESGATGPGLFAQIKRAFRKRRGRVIRGGNNFGGYSSNAAPTEADVNRVLDKMLDHGFSSLTHDEREILERASRD